MTGHCDRNKDNGKMLSDNDKAPFKGAGWWVAAIFHRGRHHTHKLNHIN